MPHLRYGTVMPANCMFSHPKKKTSITHRIDMTFKPRDSWRIPRKLDQYQLPSPAKTWFT